MTVLLRAIHLVLRVSLCISVARVLLIHVVKAAHQPLTPPVPTTLTCPQLPILSERPGLSSAPSPRSLAAGHPPRAAKVSLRSSLSMKPSRFWSMMVKAWQRHRH